MNPIRSHVVLVPALATLTIGVLAGCDRGGPPQMPPPAVNVAQVVTETISEWDPYDGRIAAIDSVEIRPRVTGYLAAMHFREGGRVAKGALLFTVDDREYQAAFASARANTARAVTRADVARLEAARSEKLKAARAISEEELESRRGELRQSEADVAAARAQERQAALNVEFTQVRSPIAGLVSSARVRPGNLVSAGSTLLTTVVSTDPVYVEFEGDERMYLKYQDLARAGERQSSRDARNPVRVGLANEEGYPHEGEMVFVDNVLDPGTGTIRVRALLSNKDGTFTPGLFARVQLLGSGERPAMMIHERAVLTDQDRKYVYVVGDDNIAQRKDVRLGGQLGPMRIVSSGLSAKDRVVVNGVRKIFFAGMPVAPQLVPMDKPEYEAPKPAQRQQPEQSAKL